MSSKMSSNFIDLTQDSIDHTVENANTDPEVVSDPCKINIWRHYINPFSSTSSFNFNADHSSSNFKFDCTEVLTRPPPSDEYNGKLFPVKETVTNNEFVEIPTPTQDQDETTSSHHDTTIQSYHVEMFNMILRKTKENKCFDGFFNEEERNVILVFENLSEDCQELYIRLFQRKKGWIRQSKIQYNRINCSTCLKLLSGKGLLLDETSLGKIEQILNLLSLAEAKTLICDLKMGKNSLSKAEIIKILKANCKKQKTLFGSMENVIIKKAKTILGRCYKLTEETVKLFSRVILLIQIFMSLPSSDNNILYHLLQVKTKQIIYPKYKVEETDYSTMFEGRSEFVNYADSVELATEFFKFSENNENEKANVYFVKCFAKLKESDPLKVSSDFPKHLLRYTSCYVLLRVCRCAVTVLEKLKDYKLAMEVIDFVLRSPFVHPKHRGELWERKVIDHEKHLGQPELAFQAARQAVSDPLVRGYFRYMFMQRLHRMENKQKKKKKKQIDFEENAFEIEFYKKVPVELLKATTLLDTSSSRRAVFISPSSSGNTMSNVEDFVLKTYKEKGFVGIHGEGSTVLMLYSLLFLDIIFSTIKGVFHSEYQNSPLDIFTDEFYLNRKDKLDERLHFTYTASENEISSKMSENWDCYHQQNIACVNWSIFPNKQEAIDLAMCMSPKLLGGICEMFCKDLRCRMSGFPDLTLWNKEKKCCKIIEVKGPGDKLSPKQIVWLDILKFLEADVTVCHVTGIGSKRKFVSMEE